jgi:hypothetical protein
MEYTDQQKQEFRSQFATKRRRQLMIAIPIIILLIPLIMADETSELVLGSIPIYAYAGIIIVLAIGCVIFSFKNWRCPACDKYLGKTINPRFCSKCGVELK